MSIKAISMPPCGSHSAIKTVPPAQIPRDIPKLFHVAGGEGDVCTKVTAYEFLVSPSLPSRMCLDRRIGAHHRSRDRQRSRRKGDNGMDRVM